jgi:hypothetical protein
LDRVSRIVNVAGTLAREREQRAFQRPDRSPVIVMADPALVDAVDRRLESLEAVVYDLARRLDGAA